MITIIDSGVANLGSVLAACSRIGSEALVSTDPDAVRSAAGLILPGVGAFADGMKGLRNYGLEKPIRDAAAAGTPILGICLGMQLLAEVSEEFGEHAGLGLLPGRVVRLDPAQSRERVPNIGWCDVEICKDARLFDGIASQAPFYFVHSYCVACSDTTDVAGRIHFGASAVAVAVERGNVFGVQFHPEKSQDSGLQILANFAQIVDSVRKVA